MKKLSFLLGLLFFISFGCEEIEKFSVNAKDGKDGKDGYSTLMFFDPIAQMKVYYLDRDRSLSFTSEDLKLYTEAKEGLKIVPDGECYKIIQVVGTQETIVGKICKGNDAYNLVFSSQPAFNLNGDNIGNTIGIHWDVDKNGVLSDGDVLKFVTPVIENGGIGPVGPMGPAGPAPVFNVDIVTNSTNWTITFTINNLIKTVIIPKPENGAVGPQGPIGLTPSLIVTQCKTGTFYRWFADVNHNGKIDEGEEIVSYFVSNNSTEPIVALSYFWDFIGQTSCTSYVSNGWQFSSGAGISDGNAFIQSAGSITTPIFRDKLNLLSITFLYGSSVTRNIKVIAIMNDNSEKIVDEFLLEGIPNFKVNEYSRYKLFEYYADLNSIKLGVTRIRIETSCPQKCIPTDLLIKQITLDFEDTNVH